MAINTSTARYPVGTHRARFSWHFYTPGRRRWLLVQIVTAPQDQAINDEQASPAQALAQDETASQARALDSYTGEMWRRRSF
jgi:hypothetical protein